MVIDHLNKLHEIGMLKELSHPKVGIIDPTYVRYREYYIMFQHMRHTGMMKMDAYTHVAECNNVHEDTVRTAVRVMTTAI